jgi:hypothetical protein
VGNDPVQSPLRQDKPDKAAQGNFNASEMQQKSAKAAQFSESNSFSAKAFQISGRQRKET